VSIGETRDRETLARFFRREQGAHVYGLADLDAPFWPDVRAFASMQGGEIDAVALLLGDLGIPLLYAVAPPGHEPTRALLAAIAAEVPTPCIATLSLGLPRALGWEFESAGEFLKMHLTARGRARDLDDGSPVERLIPADLEELERYLDSSAYGEGEGGFFRAYMLELGPYFVIRHEGEIVACGGVHVLSKRYGVVGLGNIVTSPEFRGRGYASLIMRALCRELVDQIPLIGLNVRRDNLAAVRCYTRVGFEPVLNYEEGLIEALP
jgi:GNAT superfamily N-acetyltransferase